jgi:hypothetical protein
MLFKANDYMITIVDLPSYQNDADRIFTDEEREELADFIAANPHFGKVIPATGGVRKIRWKALGHGKRGGARVIYYFRDLNMPVFLLAVYAKGEKIDLSAREKEHVRKLVDRLIEEYRARWRKVVGLGKGPT